MIFRPRSRYLQLLIQNRLQPGETMAGRFGVRNEDGDEPELFIYAPIVDEEWEAQYWGGVAAESFVKQVRDIKAKTLHLRINSPGGSVFAARAMEQALREHTARVVVHIDGLAASAASFLAQAGDHRVIAPGAMVMVHKAWTWAWGNDDDLTRQAGVLTKIDKTLAKTYAAASGRPADEWTELMRAETWFDDEEAVEYGLVDAIAEAAPTEPAEEPDDAGADNRAARLRRWDLSAYHQPPATGSTAPPPRRDVAADDSARDRQRQRARLLSLTPFE